VSFVDRIDRELTFAAVIVAAVALLAGQLSIGSAGGYTALGMAAVTAMGAHAEHSLIEGIERGGFEGLVDGGGSVLLLWLARRR
jgi:hypothetical protein